MVTKIFTHKSIMKRTSPILATRIIEELVYIENNLMIKSTIINWKRRITLGRC